MLFTVKPNTVQASVAVVLLREKYASELGTERNNHAEFLLATGRTVHGLSSPHSLFSSVRIHRFSHQPPVQDHCKQIRYLPALTATPSLQVARFHSLFSTFWKRQSALASTTQLRYTPQIQSLSSFPSY